MKTFLTVLAILLPASLVAAPVRAAAPDAATLARIERIFADWQLDSRVPGVVYGIVDNGTLITVNGLGIQDTQSGRRVDSDSRFRIASMSKAFTAMAILKLRDEGQLSLDALAETYVPELRGWTYPTADARRIRVRDLLNHSAGFVTDDPWGDRQQPLSETEFTAMLKAGVPFQSAPGSAYEYSNFGYATLGRILTNLSGKPYQSHVAETVFQPLGMAATTTDVFAVPDARLARGYRWEDGRWSAEPMMRDGEFGAMGGVVTTANDYAKWVAHLLSGWPAEAKPGGSSAVIRAMRTGGGIPHARPRPGKDAPAGCGGSQTDMRMTLIYAGGLVSGSDCLLGAVLFHSGGYPGYGSHMLLLPEAGVGLFAFSNRTYAAPLAPVWDAAGMLQRAGQVIRHRVPLSPALSRGYAAARRIWSAGRIDAEPAVLAENMLMDRSAPAWATELGRLKAESGTCDTDAPIVPNGALSGTFQWRCTTGRITGRLLLAPTGTVQIQALNLARPQ